MNKQVYLLTIVSFVVGMAELIIGGILDLIAIDLEVSISKAGLLITVFSLVFAIGAPLLMLFTARIERKRLMLGALSLFLISNLIAVASENFTMLFIARIISALSGALLAVLCMVLAPAVVDKKYTGRAIGLVIMGTSASLVLGVPIGLLIGNSFGWRAPFIMIALLTAIVMVGVYLTLRKIAPTPAVPLREQLQTLRNRPIFFIQLAMFFYLSGHLAVYAYLTPLVKTYLHFNGTWTSIVYFVFGVAAVSGGGLSGLMTDRFGSRKIILTVIVIFTSALFLLPMTFTSIPAFMMILIIWGMMSWSITPAVQSYLIEASPETAAIQQSLNNSALHFGIAFGSFVGSIVVKEAALIQAPLAGGCLAIIALICAFVSMKRSKAAASSIV
ncbi:MFS transporter [Aciduricibacillus chroicocephali]|uniref:MFS transporter n=1 Tax=Aciduricibacillus chroicocephali TaxID=3054939 RepID=A0ABY9KVY5_9BACI|nr:MFS transporter [Bacillaceae bacterium 44XB]